MNVLLILNMRNWTKNIGMVENSGFSFLRLARVVNIRIIAKSITYLSFVHY